MQKSVETTTTADDLDFSRTYSAETSSADVSKVAEVMAYAYFYLTGITSVLSMFGCVVLVVTFVIFRELQTSGRKLLVCLSVADFLTAFGNLVGIVWYSRRNDLEPSGSAVLCQFHASLTIFSSISSFLWSTSIGIHLFVCVCLRNAKAAEKLFWPFLIVCWAPPAVIAVIAWSLDILGHDPDAKGPSWCWIRPDVKIVTSLFWQYMTGKCWELACFLITALIYALIKRRLSKQKLQRNDFDSNRPNTSLISSVNRTLAFVPLIFVLLRIWGTIRFVVGAHFGDGFPGMSIALQCIVPLQGIGDSAQGLANFLLFCCFTQRVRQLCLGAFPCFGCRIHPSPSIPTPTPTSTRDHHLPATRDRGPGPSGRRPNKQSSAAARKIFVVGQVEAEDAP